MKDKNKQEAIEIFFVATGNYAPFLATTALSIIENTREALNFHVLTEGFDEKDKKLLTNFIAEQTREFPLQIDFTDVSEHLQMFSGAQIGWFKSYIPYARTLIPTLFPEINKAIYIDVDITVTCDIKEVWGIDIDKFTIAAAPEGNAADILRERERLNLHENHQYFNNGLLVLNCSKWRENKLLEKIITQAKCNSPKFIYPTQDTFNLVFDGNNYATISQKYNYMPCFAVKYTDIKNPQIFHYTMEKPWRNPSCINSEIFWKYARKTPYYEQILFKMSSMYTDILSKKIDASEKYVIKYIDRQFMIRVVNFIKKLIGK